MCNVSCYICDFDAFDTTSRSYCFNWLNWSMKSTNDCYGKFQLRTYTLFFFRLWLVRASLFKFVIIVNYVSSNVMYILFLISSHIHVCYEYTNISSLVLFPRNGVEACFVLNFEVTFRFVDILVNHRTFNNTIIIDHIEYCFYTSINHKLYNALMLDYLFIHCIVHPYCKLFRKYI